METKKIAKVKWKLEMKDEWNEETVDFKDISKYQQRDIIEYEIIEVYNEESLQRAIKQGIYKKQMKEEAPQKVPQEDPLQKALQEELQKRGLQ